ncbi:MAG: NAD-binding protein [Cyanobacteria bacterium]|nr:NAD-binding protein [Cyanobacteriota bacterium]MDW8200470.1 NAD-binding protein [Cyanobacteriota bacterium SKYGB_h_bin112]
MKPRIIVSGLDHTGYRIFCLLRQQGADVIGIHDRPLPQEPDVIIGDPQAEHTLLAAGICQADTLVLATSNDANNLAIVTQALILNPSIRIINRLFNHSLGEKLDQMLPNHVSMSVSSLAAPVFAFAAMGSRAIGQLRLFNQTWPIQEERITDAHPWKGRKLSDLWDDPTRMLIYYLPMDSQTDLVSAVEYGLKLKDGDRLIIGTKPSVRTVRKTIDQRLVSVLASFRQFINHSRSMISVSLLLLLTILLATFVYVWVNPTIQLADALYFSVGMITGAGGKEEVAEKAPQFVKFFTVIMMIVGAGIVGICYALLNDFVLGTRFSRLWSAARIPHRGHFIVCGLGGIGIQTAHQLQANGYEVVVIERDPNNRFLQTAEAFKMPLIHGDASVPETLNAANIHSAIALIAVTSDDTVNVEIALTARALVPRLPVVVRNQDPNFAANVQRVFEFTAALSPTELAAPAFAAAALGGKILGNGMTADSLWVALSTQITPDHPFCGQRVKEAAMEADFVPLYIETTSQSVHGWNLLDADLSPGDTLYLTMPANRLAQLWRSRPSRIGIS